MHTDSHPFRPFSEANPFLFALSLLSLHLGLVGAGLVAIALLVYQAGRTTPRRHG
jgi:hypothetical protein